MPNNNTQEESSFERAYNRPSLDTHECVVSESKRCARAQSWQILSIRSTKGENSLSSTSWKKMVNTWAVCTTYRVV